MWSQAVSLHARPDQSGSHLLHGLWGPPVRHSHGDAGEVRAGGEGGECRGRERKDARGFSLSVSFCFEHTHGLFLYLCPVGSPALTLGSLPGRANATAPNPSWGADLPTAGPSSSSPSATLTSRSTGRESSYTRRAWGGATRWEGGREGGREGERACGRRSRVKKGQKDIETGLEVEIKRRKEFGEGYRPLHPLTALPPPLPPSLRWRPSAPTASSGRSLPTHASPSGPSGSPCTNSSA
jgi:hypothetical protein